MTKSASAVQMFNLSLNTEGGYAIMTFQFIFFTVTIQKRQKTLEQYRHEEQIKKFYDEMKTRQTEYFIRLG